MKVKDLLEQLEFMSEEDEIRFAFQPSYPLEYKIRNEFAIVPGKDGRNILYLIEGTQVGYLPKEVREEIGW